MFAFHRAWQGNRHRCQGQKTCGDTSSTTRKAAGKGQQQIAMLYTPRPAGKYCSHEPLLQEPVEVGFENHNTDPKRSIFLLASAEGTRRAVIKLKKAMFE